MNANITLVWTLVAMTLTFFGLMTKNDIVRFLSWIVGFMLSVVSGVAWFNPTVITNTGQKVVLEGTQAYGYISLFFAWINVILILLYYAFPKLGLGESYE